VSVPDSMNPSSVSGQEASSGEVLFSAFRERRTVNRRGWLLALLVPALAALAAWVSLHEVPGSQRIITANGIKLVSPGMAQEEVLRMLGRPVGRERNAAGLDCFQHGQFSLTEPSTTLYVLCYEGGKLKDVSTRRYSLWGVAPDGTFVPAGIQMGAPPVQGKAAPAGP
jgi:hypothetical protein